ncbi:sensor histidine kinase [Neobacillus massiliamazoniensis]|uniref:Sensor histidine kinase n=1 Tax=Neobacillus massiliamazoniensis TaxID=1499688 RepID=A0A0U1NUY2_9BACI|nr:histidine kinase [Neobacillus massiliamazoniensis]CRK81867.1 sensor histidine kinase [Neobacillus massiliamazoniensis]
MFSLDTFSFFIMLCVLAPLIGAFILLFLFIFEKRIDLLNNQKREIALERELETAKFNQLNQEIQPHFFFNTLNSILSLARLDRKKELISSIETLSKLLKFKYQKSGSIVPIVEELAYTRYYLEIQKIRFRDRLQFQITIDSEVEEAVIIPFMIQTFVENAFKHSFEKIPGKAILNIDISKQDQDVRVSVWNNSSESSVQLSTDSSGLGLENLKKRLRLLFPNQHTSIQLLDVDGGTNALAIFPYTSNRKVGENDEHFAR